MRPSERKVEIARLVQLTNEVSNELNELVDGCQHVNDAYESAWKRDGQFHDEVCDICGETR